MAKITSDAYMTLCFIFGMLHLGDLHLVSPFFVSTEHHSIFKLALSSHRHNSPYLLDICYSSFGMLSYKKDFNSKMLVAVISDKLSYYLLSLTNNWNYTLGWAWQIVLECRMKSSSGFGFASFSASGKEGGHEIKNFKFLLPLKEEILPSFHSTALFLSLHFLWCYHKCFWKEPAWVTPTKAAMLAERSRPTFGSSICSCQLKVLTL